MIKILSVALLILIGGVTLYALYKGMIYPLIYPLLKNKQ